MTSHVTAYCWRSGLIGFARGSLPDGVLPLGTAPDKPLKAAVNVLARHSKDSEDLIVSGVPEASDDADAINAVSDFTVELLKRLKQ